MRNVKHDKGFPRDASYKVPDRVRDPLLEKQKENCRENKKKRWRSISKIC